MAELNQNNRSSQEGDVLNLSTDGSSYEVATNSEIYGLQQQVISHKEKANALMDTIKLSVNDPYVSSLIYLYNKEMDCVSKLSDNIDIMYENES
jgi:hypothetical protein